MSTKQWTDQCSILKNLPISFACFQMHSNSNVSWAVYDTECVTGCRFMMFTMQLSYASTFLGVVILSVRLSVRHMPTFWQNQTMHCRYSDTTRKSNRSSFLTLTAVGGQCPFSLNFVLKVTHPHSKNADFNRFLLIMSHLSQEMAKKVQLWRIGSWTWAFQWGI